MTVLRIKRIAADLFPWLYEFRRRQRRQQQLISEAKALVKQADELGIDAAIDAILKSSAFRSSQKHTEIRNLLEHVAAIKPKVIVEIGSFRGGTLFLFLQVAPLDTQLVSLDISHAPEKLKAYQHFRRGQQKFQSVTGDSHNGATLEELRGLLKGKPIDVLFIDGDHSYEGVKQDYEMYAPLVRSGGIIAFHDIVEDYETRYGAKTQAYVGGVPRYWSEIKVNKTDVAEYIDDVDQDGFGIGVLVHE